MSISCPTWGVGNNQKSFTKFQRFQGSYFKRQKFRGWKVSWFAGFIRYVGKSFLIFPSPCTHHLHTFMVFQLYKTATSVSTKALRSASREFSLKLSLAYSEMDESTLALVLVCRTQWECGAQHRYKKCKVHVITKVWGAILNTITKND